MSKKITFIGDVMLGRMINKSITESSYQLVSDELKNICKYSDLTIANLESPITTTKDSNLDHLHFIGSEECLKQFKWIDYFTLANNHINDAAEVGMDETILLLEKNGFKHNGLFLKNEKYYPIIIEEPNYKIAIITLTDMMNIPFESENKWQVLRVGEPRIMNIIKELKDSGFMVIIYAHIGALFTRYPNPKTFKYLHECVDNGASCIVTVHSHCLGGIEIYKGIPIFHSLGDFVMDGNSFRRRKSAMLTIEINNAQIEKWEITPAIINENYQTVTPSYKIKRKMIKGFETVGKNISKNKNNYSQFYKWQYKKEMIMHTTSTLAFLIHTRGFCGMLKLIYLRIEEVTRMFKWVLTDRSKIQRDDDAIKADRKKIKQDQIF